MSATTDTITVEQAIAQCYEHYNAGEYNQCLDIVARILQEHPSNIEAKYIAALTYTAAENYDLAERLFADCCEVVKDNAELYFNIGLLYAKQGKNKEAINLYNAALSINDKHIGALNNIANIYNESGNSAVALQYFNKILEIDDSLYFIYNNISLIYKKTGMLNDALAYVLKSVELSPTTLEPNHNAALIYYSMARNEQAIEFYKKCYEFAPDNLTIALEYQEVLGKVCDWDEGEKLKIVVDELISKHGADNLPPVMTDIQKNVDPKEYLKTVRQFTHNRVKHTLNLYPKFHFDESRKDKNKQKIRIGYMSSDIKDHPVSHLMRGVFKNHDKNNFEIYLYSFSTVDNSGYKEQIESYCDKFVDIKNVENYETARIINEDEIDILIDLNGHTGTARTNSLALKPAPIQVNYLGYIGSMGADFIDYIITDKTVTPPEAQAFYDEKFVYLPDCYQANDNTLEISDAEITKKSEGLPEDKFIFCSFNQTYKIEPVMFKTWMNILKNAPDSVLWLYKGSIFEGDNLAAENLKKEAEKHGVDSNRLIFAKAELIGTHLKRVALADMALDTRLYNGGTVTSQTLWAGVPVITLQGEHFASRMASSILSAVGLPELITHNQDDYEKLAIDFATNPDKLKTVKSKLAKNKNSKPLFDTPLFTKNLEAAYKKMWENYCSADDCTQIDVKNKYMKQEQLI